MPYQHLAHYFFPFDSLLISICKHVVHSKNTLAPARKINGMSIYHLSIINGTIPEFFSGNLFKPSAPAHYPGFLLIFLSIP
jgi:hypothetical protein